MSGRLASVVGLWATGSYWLVTKSGPDGKPVVDPLKTQLQMEDRTGRLLVTRGGGEYRPGQQNWVVPLCDKIYKSLRMPFSKPCKRLTYTWYIFKILLGLVLRPWIWLWTRRVPEFEHAQWTREDIKLFREVKEQRNGQALYMCSVPSPRAIKLFSGLLFGHQRLFEAKLKRQLDEILEIHPQTVLQWELPVELAFGSIPMPKWLKWIVFRRFMQMVVRMAADMPTGTRHAFHLCWGDLNNRPFTPIWLQSEMTKVILINVINELEIWLHNGGTQMLFAVHDPFCDGHHAPKPAYKAVMAYKKHLKSLPEYTTYAMGVLHRNFTVDQIINFVETFRVELADRIMRIAIGAPCGDPRKEGGQAEIEEQYRKARQVYYDLSV